MGGRLIITPQTEPEPVETAEGTFLVTPDSKVFERLFTSNDEIAFQEWLSDLRRDDEITFETRCGEGWTEDHWREKWKDEGWPQ